MKVMRQRRKQEKGQKRDQILDAFKEGKIDQNEVNAKLGEL